MRALYAEEVMELLGISRTTVTRYTKSGKFEGVKIGSSIRYPWPQFVDMGLLEESDIREHIEGRKK